MELTKGQKSAIQLLAVSPLSDRFYWTGGTLLAYHYFHHRRSLDLDFFSEKPFHFEEVNQFIQILKEKGKFSKVEFQKIFDRYEFLLKNEEVLRIEFVYYNREKKTLKIREKLLGIYVDSLEDVAANKVIAYFDRNDPKDLFDIYFLIKKGKFTVEKLLRLAKEKFGVSLTESLFWAESFKSLSFLSKLKPVLLEGEEKKKEDLIKTVEQYFKENSDKFLKRSLR